jgi:hypothetical protein
MGSITMGTLQATMVHELSCNLELYQRASTPTALSSLDPAIEKSPFGSFLLSTMPSVLAVLNNNPDHEKKRTQRRAPNVGQHL